MTILAIGDIGAVDGMFHIGDEAMFDAAVQELTSRGASIVGLSSAPAESAERYGTPMLPRLGFAGLDRTALSARRARILAAARGEVALAPDDPARAVIEALDSVSGLLHAGGGNLASRWPVHLFERATLTELAVARGLPVVFTGQTLGPDLLGDDEALLRTAVAAATRFGAREPTTHALVTGWGRAARLGVDDASFLSPAAPPEAPPGVLVSLSGWYGGVAQEDGDAAIARLVDAAAAITGGPVVFHAHFGALEAGPRTARGDERVHDRIRALLTTASDAAPTGDTASAVALAQHAGLLITSRYHPAVFAAPAGTPVLALATDDYTRIKLDGVLGHWDGHRPVDLASLTGRDADPAAICAHVEAERTRIADRARERIDAHRARAATWWDDVAAVLTR
ncbi:polysaccharide pyruvyl transferase family protein [Microbacterium sp. SORGH_AS_0888]|uniref:polysaccharide pyruvyl transferase family protein n=1 Tax=Microbacterium sp. SORGH_AS_0888 TaxID=3041791 RepID=UPI002789907F|nr:polysaccharide pyruvyl transferase family protein [Microbacterium sp. SORGH_AS_0888]MDQ1130844.1 polysaccharide pyruvyl transferase WcaK-like protein [Microbacterium sp. SORGH_AS_0888]